MTILKKLKIIEFSIKHFSKTSKINNNVNIFDSTCKKHQRKIADGMFEPKQYDYIRKMTGEMLSERICDINRDFKVIGQFGNDRDYVYENIPKSIFPTEAFQFSNYSKKSYRKFNNFEKIKRCCISEENSHFLSSEYGNYFDLIFSNLW
ncbi:hypothetical protein A3Q56_01624 [Intoshia linei]|uniref:Uncharacterized protein n=1 Tax=Intoshia linei TaxID=1819745 RepID=A0A177B8D9_9BILA|nr:hypothetical protein A3Q56_01624 [Intoshia linei]